MTAGRRTVAITDAFEQRHAYQRSLWHVTAGRHVSGDAFEAEAAVDVAVVGAGIAGASAALELQRAGVSTALVEASYAAAGATGRSAGFIVPAFSAVRPHSVLDTNGERGRWLLEAVTSSADELFTFLRDNSVEHGGGQNGWFHPLHSAEARERVQDDATVWGSVGAKIESLDRYETARRTGIDAEFGAVLFPSGGTVHPVKVVLGIIETAQRLGMRLYLGTPVTLMTREGNRWKLATARGALYANRLLLTTNGRTQGLCSRLDATVLPLMVCQIASSPVAPAVRSALLAPGQSLSDSRKNLFTYRFDEDGRLITGAMPVLPVTTGRSLGHGMLDRAARMLKLDLSGISVQHIWFGQASVTSDRLPQIQNIGPDAFAMTACNGRGLAMSSLLGRTLARAMIADRLNEMPVEVRRPEPIAHRWLQTLGARMYSLYGRFKDRFY